jgi:large subunit ribosomal protein L25
MLKIEAFERNEIGKTGVKKILKEGYIPAVAYGHNEKTIPLKIKYQDLKNLIHDLPSESATIELSIGGKKFITVIKELTRHYRTHDIHHIDFQILHKDEMVKIKVPIELVGECEGVKEGGIIDFVVRDVEITCLPDNIPEKIVLDITHLKIGHSIHIGDIKTEGKFKINLPPHTPVVSIVVPKKLEAITPTPTAEAGIVEEPKEPEVISKKKEEEEKEEEKEEKPKEEKKK